MDNQEFDPIIPKKKSPFFRFIALFIAITVLLLSARGYFYLIHPEPKDAVKIEDVQQFIEKAPQIFTSHGIDRISIVLSETEDDIKTIANYISAKSCKKADSVCQSKALFYFVRDQIKYVSDARFQDQLQNPLLTLKTGGADCEDKAVLLIALEKAIGNDARIVFVPGHAYAQIKIPKYKDKWINLDSTCEYCKFDELVDSSALSKKTFHKL